MSTLTPNEIAFTGAASEYCQAMQQADETDREAFVSAMLRLLPRIYIMASDLNTDSISPDDGYLSDALDEDSYESARAAVASLLDPDDIYLETFEEDMKYSDTPVSASISESLADIYQVLYNFIETMRDATDETASLAFRSVYDDFRNYWSQTLVNVMRPLNALFNSPDNQDF